MKKIYYGLWQDFYSLSWTVRFAVEVIIICVLLFFAFGVLRAIFRKLKLREVGIKLVALIGTSILPFFGRDNEWAHNADEGLVRWANRKMEFPMTGRQNKLQILIVVFMCMIYLLGILPETPLINYLDDGVKDKVCVIQQSAQKLEAAVSEGYNSYEPILTWNEKKQNDTKQAIQIHLDKKSEKIYKEASSKSKAVAKVTKKDKIEYQSEYKKVKKKIWLKVHLPERKIEGWLRGEAVEKTQMKKIIGR